MGLVSEAYHGLKFRVTNTVPLAPAASVPTTHDALAAETHAGATARRAAGKENADLAMVGASAPTQLLPHKKSSAIDRRALKNPLVQDRVVSKSPG